MLVLTRKVKEQILIGDDIKVTFIRCQGNKVRIGVEAPRDVRVVRGELKRLDETALDDENELSDREQAFAHPIKNVRPSENASTTDNRINQQTRTITANRLVPSSAPQVFVGSVDRNGTGPQLSRTPLADFVATS